MSPGIELTLVAVVIAFAAVQSVFGVGLLVFGTPGLLLLGVPFEQVLAYLLPCSITISAFQIATTGGLTLEPIRKGFLLYTAPAVVAGTALILALGREVSIKPIVGAMLLATATLRTLGPAREAASWFVRRMLGPFCGLLGFLHGISNLGGGVLTFIVGSAYTQKEDVRRHVAFGYGLMAALQAATLFVTTPVEVRPALWLGLPALAGATYWVVGQRLFRATGQVAYQTGLTGLLALVGLVLIAAG